VPLFSPIFLINPIGCWFIQNCPNYFRFIQIQRVHQPLLESNLRCFRLTIRQLPTPRQRLRAELHGFLQQHRVRRVKGRWYLALGGCRSEVTLLW
jgi:hypothetical protein